MGKAIKRKPPIVQMYDYSKVVEYYKIHHGLVFSHKDIVRAETVDSRLELHIKADKMPDKLFINEQEYKLTPIYERTAI